MKKEVKELKSIKAEVFEKVTKGIFCIYDLINERDVRIEINLPGGTHVYCLEPGSDRITYL